MLHFYKLIMLNRYRLLMFNRILLPDQRRRCRIGYGPGISGYSAPNNDASVAAAGAMARRSPRLDTGVACSAAFSDSAMTLSRIASDLLPMVVAFALVRKKQKGASYQRISGRASLATR